MQIYPWWIQLLAVYPLPPGTSFRACCILWGVPLVEDGVATYMSIFDHPVNSEMGCSLIDICSISVTYLPNCIVKEWNWEVIDSCCLEYIQVNISGNSKKFSGSSTVITMHIYPWWIQLLAVYPIPPGTQMWCGHLYVYFGLSLCKIVRSSVILLFPLFDQPVNSEMGCSLIDICFICVVIEEQLPHSHLKNKIHYLHIKQA
jgi:hypothetical protein